CSPAVRTRRTVPNGDWYREVVQRHEGLRFHHPGRRRGRRLLSSHRDQDGWLPLTRGGREGRVRGRQGAERLAGAERPQGRNLESRTTAEARPTGLGLRRFAAAAPAPEVPFRWLRPRRLPALRRRRR